jgi:uncharacterized protein (TIGR00251 family)
MERPWCSRDGERLRIVVHVQPNASRTEISGVVEGALKIRLHAPPVDGKANEALINLMAERLKVAKRDVDVSRGHGSRQKILEVRTEMAIDQLEDLLR